MPSPYAGLVLAPKWEKDESLKPKIALMHGQHDDLVPYEWGTLAFDFLNTHQAPVALTDYEDEVGHTGGLAVPELKAKARDLLVQMATPQTLDSIADTQPINAETPPQ